jgi:hypothetical protein
MGELRAEQSGMFVNRVRGDTGPQNVESDTLGSIISGRIKIGNMLATGGKRLQLFALWVQEYKLNPFASGRDPVSHVDFVKVSFHGSERYAKFLGDLSIARAAYNQNR